MQTHTVIGALELDSQVAELLPERETLLFDIKVAPVVGVNLAIAINAATINSSAAAAALQGINVSFG
jgi:hypothetical protein